MVPYLCNERLALTAYVSLAGNNHPRAFSPPLYSKTWKFLHLSEKWFVRWNISSPKHICLVSYIYKSFNSLQSARLTEDCFFVFQWPPYTKYSLNMYKWRIIISGSIVLIISYSSRTAIFYWRTKRSSDKCVRRWQSEASKLTSLTDRLSSSAFLPRMVKLSFVLSRFYCDLLNPNRSRIKKKKKKDRTERITTVSYA